MAKVKITILSTGDIANAMAKTLSLMGDKVELYGVLSRDLKRAKKFAKKYKIKQAFDSFEAVINDGKTQLVYIGSPHHMHFEHSKFFLENKIAVLCEKPLCVNSEQAQELMMIAKENKTLLVDATWSRYMPFIEQVKALAQKHNLGRLMNLHSALGIQKQNVDRMILPQMAGGSLLDVGIYPVTFACGFNETEVKELKAMSISTDLGVDQSTTILMKFEDGMLATLQSSMGSILSDVSALSYEFGKIECYGIPNVKKIKVYNDSKLLETVKVEKQLTGYEYEVIESIKALKSNRIEPQSLSHQQSLKVLQLLDQIREEIGLVYPFEN